MRLWGNDYAVYLPFSNDPSNLLVEYRTITYNSKSKPFSKVIWWYSSLLCSVIGFSTNMSRNISKLDDPFAKKKLVPLYYPFRIGIHSHFLFSRNYVTCDLQRERSRSLVWHILPPIQRMTKDLQISRASLTNDRMSLNQSPCSRLPCQIRLFLHI